MGSKETDKRVERDRKKGGSIKRQERGKGLQQRQAKEWCKVKGRGRKKTGRRRKKTGKGCTKRQARGVKRQAMGWKTTGKAMEKTGKRGCKKTGKGVQKRQGWVKAKKDRQVGPRSTDKRE
jgi:hypothetical protein